MPDRLACRCGVRGLGRLAHADTDCSGGRVWALLAGKDLDPQFLERSADPPLEKKHQKKDTQLENQVGTAIRSEARICLLGNVKDPLDYSDNDVQVEA